VANAYLDLATSKATGIFNICSGVARSGHDILELLCAAMNARPVLLPVESKRLIDPNRISGNNKRLVRTTGWSPTVSIATSIQQFVDGMIEAKA
jgi:GDP-4-dehydro-6-deoxy-D-mannose reductase